MGALAEYVAGGCSACNKCKTTGMSQTIEPGRTKREKSLAFGFFRCYTVSWKIKKTEGVFYEN